jgi:hypothetical protein
MTKTQTNPPPRIERERRTWAAMVRLYCRAQHGAGGLCPACEALLAYAFGRLERCPFGGSKPTCARCPIHCYQPARRAEVQRVMRYAGPRMLFRHPWMALRHQLDRLVRRAKHPRTGKEQRHGGA